MSTHPKPEKTGQASDLGISKAIFLASLFGQLVATISSPMLWYLLFHLLSEGWLLLFVFISRGWFLLLLVFVPLQLATWLSAPLAWLWTRIGYVSFVSALIAGTVLGTVWAVVLSSIGGAPNILIVIIIGLGISIPFGVSGACAFWAVQNRERFAFPGAQLKEILFGFRVHIMTILIINFLTSGIGLIFTVLLLSINLYE